MNALLPIAVSFGRTDQGLFAAQFEDRGWVAVPEGQHLRIFSGWRMKTPMASWSRIDFSCFEGIEPDERAFRARVDDYAEHRRQLRELDRRSVHPTACTPWGSSQQSVEYAEGVVCHSTASHGGFFVAPEQNLAIDARLRNADGWYEEDGEWAKVAFTFPSLFTSFECRRADRELRNQHPDAWEAMLGVVLLPGESYRKDERHFRQAHVDHWVVVSASRSDCHAGMLECNATRAGLRGVGECRKFLVQHDDYDPGRFGFVIDEARHPRLTPAGTG